MKYRKLIVISPIGLVLLAGLIVAWWFLGDDDWIRGKIEASVSEMTGRSLSIDGAFTVDWSASPVLVAEDIHFSNPPWAVNPDLASLKKLEVSIDLFSLLADQKRINYIVINGLVIALEEHESGQNSWEILTEPEEPAATSEAPLEQLPISVGYISLSDFSLLHEASDRTEPLDFHVGQLELSGGGDQLVRLISDGRLGGEPFDIVGELGPLKEFVLGGETSHDIRLTIGGIVLQSQGSFEQSSTLAGANIKLVFSGPEFEWLLTQLAVPQFSHGDFDFRLDITTQGEQTHMSLKGDLGSLEAFAEGELDDSLGAKTQQLTANVVGDDLGGLLEVFGVSGIPNNVFNMKMDISHALGITKLQTLVLETAENTISVSGQAGDWPDLLDTELEFSVNGPDLRVWGEAVHFDRIPDVDFELNGRLSRVGSQPASTQTHFRVGDSQIRLSGSLGRLPAMAGADLELVADGTVGGALVQMLGLGDIPGEDLSLRAAIERDDSYTYLNEISFKVADNHLQISGKLGRWPELEGTDLIFSMDGPDLSAWSPMLKMEGLPSSAFSLHGEISPTTVGLALDSFRLDIGSSHFVINGSIGEPPGFIGTALSIDAAGPDLAQFQTLPGMHGAPAQPFSIKGDIGVDDTGLNFDGLNLLLGHNSLHLNGLLGLNKQLEGSNLQTRVIVPNLARLGPLFGVEGLPENRLTVNGNYQRISDGWAFQLSDGSFAAATFESEGKYIHGNGGHGIEASSHIVAPSLAQLGRIAGLDYLPEQAMDIKGFAAYDAGRIELRDIEGRVGDSVFEVSANLVNPPGWSGSEITLSASGPDISQLLVDRYFEDILPFKLEGSITRDEQAIKISQVKARLGSLQASVDGVIGNLDDLSDTGLDLGVTAPSLQPIGVLIDYPLPDEPFQLSARFEGSPSAFSTRGLRVELGDSDLAGELVVDLEGKPTINGVFKSNRMDLAWIGPSDDEQDTSQKAGETDKREYVIPDTPIAFKRIDTADSDMDITVDRLDLPNLSYYDIHIHSQVTDGDLHLDTFQIRGEEGGSLNGDLTIERADQSDITSIVLDLEGHDIQLGIGRVVGQDPETIPHADIVAKLTGAGVTYRDLAGSLNGHVEMVQGPGLTKSSGMGLVFGNFIGEFLNLLNPFAKTEEFTVNECAVVIVDVKSGLVKVDPVVSQTDKMTIVAQGDIDLHTEKVNFTFNTKLRKGVGISASMVINPFIGITGMLASPVVGLDPAAVAVTGTVAVATLGISLLVKSLADRYLSSKDPCGDALKNSREQLKIPGRKGDKKK